LPRLVRTEQLLGGFIQSERKGKLWALLSLCSYLGDLSPAPGSATWCTPAGRVPSVATGEDERTERKGKLKTPQASFIKNKVRPYYPCHGLSGQSSKLRDLLPASRCGPWGTD
jgi:hypothetical protein